MTRLIYLLIVFFFICLTACKDYYNDTILWTDNIETGTDIQSVMDSQPDFIEIAWRKPDTLETELLYEITEIKGSHDPLNMSHYLVFVNDKYKGRITHK